MFGRQKEESEATAAQPTAAVQTLLGPELATQLERLFGSTQTAPEIIDLLLNFAASHGISDILLEPMGEVTRVRMRLDGALQEAGRIPYEVYPAVAARIKVLANADTGTREINQEGKFLFSQDGRTINVRMALTSVVGGEMIALRLHDSGSAVKAFADHGMDDLVRVPFEKMLGAKTGLVVVCGPTGAGKTSTLYSAINLLNNGKTNIISIEDPVEYVMNGINQMQVDEERGLSFASGLRVILRLNPDIIFVGEIRDKETAQIGIESALTGHLVISTLHANSAVSALSRLRDLQIESYFINAALKGVLCQRLVRRTCKTCGAMVVPNANEQQLFKQIMGRDLTQQFVGTGCAACAGSGFQGRIGMYELLEMNDLTRPLVTTNQTEREIFMNLRAKAGFRSLVEDGMLKVEQGLTTVMEVVSNAYGD